MKGSDMKGSEKSKIFNDKMKNIPCFILGNGPSLKKIDLSILKNYFTLGINRIFFIFDPTILIWQDLALWQQEHKKIETLKAIKYCRKGASTKDNFYNFQLEQREYKISRNARVMHGRGSSGAIAYQFACAMGCETVILVGMDCCYDKNGDTDFYGKNTMHRKQTLPSCVDGLKFIKKNSQGRTIVNCSHNKVFSERITIEEAIKKYCERSYTREELEKILLT